MVATIELTSSTVRRPVSALTPPYNLYNMRAARIGDLLLVVEARRFLVVDPLQRHARDVRTQDQLRESARRRCGDDAQVILDAVIGAFEIDPCMAAVR